MNLLLSLNKALTLWPDREAVVDGDFRIPYRVLGERVARLARALTRQGIERGRVLGILAPNIHAFLETYYASAVLGAVLNPLNFRLNPRELVVILNDSGAEWLLAHTDFARAVAECLPECPSLRGVFWIGDGPRPPLSVTAGPYEEALAREEGSPLPAFTQFPADTLAHLYYTSGTTGRPKGVMLTHGNVTFHALSAIAELGLSDRDTWLHAAPLFHLADAWASFALTWVGGRHVFLPYFEAGKALQTIQAQRVTLSNLIPTMLNLMVNHPQVSAFDTSSLRVILSGGAPIAPKTVRRIVEAFGCDYIQTYGMTETSPYLTVSVLKDHLRHLPAERRLEIKSRTGRPFIGVELKVVRPDGSEVERDDREVGEILVRGPIVTPGYWKQPEATAAAFTEDGFLKTGDLAVIDAEGYVNIVDRAKDMILTGGENVYSTEVEYVLYEHPGVLECAVIGVPDEKWGEAVTAVVVPRTGHTPTEQELVAFVKSHLAGYKAPKRIYFISELPRLGSGKISKKALRGRRWEG